MCAIIAITLINHHHHSGHHRRHHVLDEIETRSQRQSVLQQGIIFLPRKEQGGKKQKTRPC